MVDPGIPVTLEEVKEVKVWRPQIVLAMVFLTLIAFAALIVVIVLAKSVGAGTSGEVWIAVGVLASGTITVAGSIAALGLKIIELEFPHKR